MTTAACTARFSLVGRCKNELAEIRPRGSPARWQACRQWGPPWWENRHRSSPCTAGWTSCSRIYSLSSKSKHLPIRQIPHLESIISWLEHKYHTTQLSKNNGHFGIWFRRRYMFLALNRLLWMWAKDEGYWFISDVLPTLRTLAKPIHQSMRCEADVKQEPMSTRNRMKGEN